MVLCTIGTVRLLICKQDSECRKTWKTWNCARKWPRQNHKRTWLKNIAIGTTWLNKQMYPHSNNQFIKEMCMNENAIQEARQEALRMLIQRQACLARKSDWISTFRKKAVPLQDISRNYGHHTWNKTESCKVSAQYLSLQNENATHSPASECCPSRVWEALKRFLHPICGETRNFRQFKNSLKPTKTRYLFFFLESSEFFQNSSRTPRRHHAATTPPPRRELPPLPDPPRRELPPRPAASARPRSSSAA